MARVPASVLTAIALLGPTLARQNQSRTADPTVAVWAQEAVNTLRQKEILQGLPDGTYRGMDTVKRYEMMEVLLRLREKTEVLRENRKPLEVEVLLNTFSPQTLLPPQGASDPDTLWFKDLDYGHHDIVTRNTPALAKTGLLNGYPDGYLRRKRVVTRAEMAVFIARLLERLEHAPSLKLDRSRFRDVQEDEWWFGAMLVATGSGVMEGYADQTFRGKQPVTRNELAVTLVRLLKLAGQIQ